MPRSEYGLDTWIDPEEFAYNTYSGTMHGSGRRARVILADGTYRLATIGIPDTFFSIPGYVSIKGKKVTGYVSMFDVEDAPPSNPIFAQAAVFLTSDVPGFSLDSLPPIVSKYGHTIGHYAPVPK